jgi:murein L,D-transpeptidase YafK
LEKSIYSRRLKVLMPIFLLVCLATAGVMVSANLNWHPLPRDVIADRILVEKAARRLTLLRDGTPLKTYRVALGGEPIGPKEQEGDLRTPEGIYRIDLHKEDSDYHRALHVSYPEQRDIERAGAAGVPPGSDIMVHGLPNGRGWIGAFHRRNDWTAGCIAVTDLEIEEIWRAVPDGTPIEIRP